MTPAHAAARAPRRGLRPLAALTVAITGRCNLRCEHCWVESGTPGSPGHVPAEAVIRLARELAELGGETIWITGGEPLAHPSWAAILEGCCEVRSLRTVGLQTNGTLLDDDAVETLRALPRGRLLVQVSLDGESPRTHDRVRGAGSFDATIRGLTRLSAGGLGKRTTIAFTEMRHSMGDVPELLRLVEELGLRGLVAGTLVRGGRAARGALEPPDAAQYLALLERFHGDARFRDRYQRYGTFPAVEWWKGRAEARGDPCTFLAHAYASAAGTLYPCTLCHADAFSAADVFSRPLAEVLGDAGDRAAELVQLARARPERLAECAGCPARRACGGGCMGRALASRGSLAAAEDRCTLRRAVHGWTGESARPRPRRPDAPGSVEAAPGRGAPPATERPVARRPPAEHIGCMDIHELLAQEREAIVEDAWRSIVALTHYQRDGKEATRARVETLYDHVARAIRVRDLGELLDYSERIARQRFEAKFDLMEVQTAYFMLEEAIGRRALARLPSEDLAEALGLVGTAMRRGKDALARAYISLTARKRAPSLDLSDLFKGR